MIFNQLSQFRQQVYEQLGKAKAASASGGTIFCCNSLISCSNGLSPNSSLKEVKRKIELYVGTTRNQSTLRNMAERGSALLQRRSGGWKEMLGVGIITVR